MIPVAIAVLAVLVLVLALFFLPRLLLKRAIRKVITRLRQEGATSPERAKTLAELRLESPGGFGTVFRFRDYRPYAIRLLGQARIILGTEEGGVFLSEENLSESHIREFSKVED